MSQDKYEWEEGDLCPVDPVAYEKYKSEVKAGMEKLRKVMREEGLEPKSAHV
ncbi:MAG: hypothetical protein FWE87_02400 [Coriobacteriia bacterium]|nr:hypothetical protein [Coriobacteriia bacterium]